MVRLTKLVLPAFAALLIGLLIILPQIKKNLNDTVSDIIMPHKGELEKFHMEKSVFYITDNKNLVNNFHADTLDETQAGSKIIKLTNPRGLLPTEDNKEIRITAPVGFYNQTTKLLTLSQNVQITYSSGMTTDTEELFFDFDKGKGYGLKPVVTKSETANITSRGFEYYKDKNLLVYTGKRCILWNTLSGEKLYEYSIPDGVPIGTVFIDPTHIFIGFRIQTTDPKQHYVIEYEYLHPADERNSLSKYYYLATVWNAETGALEASEEIDFARICGYPVSKDEVFASGYHVESFFELIHSHPYCPRYISGKKAEFRLSVIEDTRHCVLR